MPIGCPYICSTAEGLSGLRGRHLTVQCRAIEIADFALAQMTQL